MATSFNFASAPDEQLVADILAANQFPDEMFAEFVQLVFGLLVNPEQAQRMLDKIERFAQTHEAKPSQVRQVSRAWMTFLRSAQRGNLQPKAFFDDLMQIGYPKGKATYVGKIFKNNLAALSRTFVGQTLVVNEVVDLQWKFGVSAGSSDSKQSGGDSFLQLRLTLRKNDEIRHEFMEMSLPQFYAFLSEMEKAKASLEFFS